VRESERGNMNAEAEAAAPAAAATTSLKTVYGN